tara:strand:- start:1183 stop:2115 length:933 start_codon:yes stop_codon:yes gene_type:complete
MKILVTGGSGLVGQALQSISTNYNYDFIFISSKDCDLTNYQDTLQLFNKIKPDYVIHLAACVGGLFKNMNHKVDMFEKNITINSNVLKCAHLLNVKKCISCLSTCIFPDKTTYPINETMLQSGPPHTSNDAYAYAKRMLQIQSNAYNEQYNRNFVCIIPTNIYGPHDNFHLDDAHVIPALIHQCYLAKQNNKPFIIKGTGKPLRQFIYSTDLATLIMWSMEKYTLKDSLILSVSEKDEISIKDISYLIAKEFNYEHNILFDSNYSDGQFKKTADNSKLLKYHGPLQFTRINEGIKKSVAWFVNNYDSCRK